MGKTAKRFALGTLFAAVAGYVAGILTAPKSGKETRDDIKDATAKSVNEAEKQLKKLHTELNKVIKQATDEAEDIKGKTRTEVDAAIAKTMAVKEKARQVLSALHEGDADDKDLEKAIKEATKAIDHLKSFVSKKS